MHSKDWGTSHSALPDWARWGFLSRTQTPGSKWHTRLYEASEEHPSRVPAQWKHGDGTNLRLDGFENGDVHQCDLTLQENRGTELEAFKLILETPKSYVFMGCHVMAGHECMVCNI